jgi:hypothetical protein
VTACEQIFLKARRRGEYYAPLELFVVQGGRILGSQNAARGVLLKNKYLVWLVCCAALATGACHEKFIPNTELASQRYFDNSGTPSADDDIDRVGLEKVLTDRFKELKTMRYEIKYRNVFESIGVIYVEYTYNMAFQYQIGDKTKWSNRTADNRLELERVADGFLILTGM